MNVTLLDPSLEALLNDILKSEQIRTKGKNLVFKIGLTNYELDEVLLGAKNREIEHLTTFALISYMGTFVERREVFAIRLLKIVARNSSFAKYKLSILYSDRKEHARALKLLEQLLQEEYLPAYGRLAVVYWFGNGVEQSTEKYLELLKLSSERGSFRSKLKLAKNKIFSDNIVNKIQGLVLFAYGYFRFLFASILNSNDERIM